MINKSIKYSPKLKALGFLGKSSFAQVCNCEGSFMGLALYAGSVPGLSGGRGKEQNLQFK